MTPDSFSVRVRALLFTLAAATAVVIAGLVPAGGAGAGPSRPVTQVLSWTPLGFSGGEFTTIVSVPENPCVVAWTALNNSGLGVSTDCGNQYANLFLASAYDVTAQNENIGYVAAGTIGMAKTIDTGSNWFDINEGLPGVHDARAVILDIAHPESLVCGLNGGGVFRGGPKSPGNDTILWAPMNDGLSDLRVRALARVRGGSFMLAATISGIYRCVDGTWTSVAPGVTANSIVVDPGDSSIVWAATEGGVQRSTNQGQTWFASSSGLPNIPMNDIARRSDSAIVVYVATRGAGVWESTNGGATWHKFGPDLPDNDVRAVMSVVGAQSATNAEVYAGTKTAGLFRSAYSTPATPVTWGRVKDTYRR